MPRANWAGYICNRHIVILASFKSEGLLQDRLLATRSEESSKAAYTYGRPYSNAVSPKCPYRRNRCTICTALVICFDLLWFALICFDFFWFLLICFDLLWFDLLLFVLICFDLICFDLLWFALICYALLCFALLCYLRMLRMYVNTYVRSYAIENLWKIYCAHACAHLCRLVHTCAHLCTFVQFCAQLHTLLYAH